MYAAHRLILRSPTCPYATAGNGFRWHNSKMSAFPAPWLKKCESRQRVIISAREQQTKSARKFSSDQSDGSGRRNFFEFKPRGELKKPLSLSCRSSVGDPGWRSECGSRGRRLVTAVLGRLRQDTPGRHDDRSASASSLDGGDKARVMPAVRHGSRIICGSGLAKHAIFRTIGTARPTSSPEVRGCS